VAKESGLGFSVTVDDSGGSPQVISNDITNMEFGTPMAVQDVTGLDKLAIERLLLLADMSCEFTGVFNETLSHAVFKTVPSTRVARTTLLAISGQTLTAVLLYTDYSFERSEDGSLVFTAPGQLSNGTAPAWS
jgi:hypothetical protein